MSSSAHVNNKTKSVSIIGEGPSQGLEGTTLYAENMYSVNFTTIIKKLCVSFRYYGDNSWHRNGTEIINFKAKNSQIVANPLRLGNISEDSFSVNMKKTGLNDSVFDFSLDYRGIAFKDILDIHKYLMKKNGI